MVIVLETLVYYLQRFTYFLGAKIMVILPFYRLWRRFRFWWQSLVPVSVPVTEPGSGSGTGFHWRFRFRFRFRCEIQFRSSPNPDDVMSLEAEKYARITLSHARTTIQCGWIRCEEDLPDNWSSPFPSQRWCWHGMDTSSPNPSSWDVFLCWLHGLHLDWDFLTSPSLQPVVLEPVGWYPPRNSPELKHRRGMAQRVQKPGRLLPSYHLEIIGGVEAGASYYRHEVL